MGANLKAMALSKAVCLALMVALLAHPSAAQESSAPASSPKDAIVLAEDALRTAEAAHPGNTVEVANALDKLINAQMDQGKAAAETLDQANREMAVAKAAAGENSKLYVSALTTASGVSVALNRTAEARVLAERAFEVARKEFPDTDEFTGAADALAYACDALGDTKCALNADDAAVAVERKGGAAFDWALVETLSTRADFRDRSGDTAGAGSDVEEALAIALRTRPNDPSLGILESNAGSHYLHTQEFSKAITHFNRALELIAKTYGPDSPLLESINGNLAEMYNRTGQFDLAWKSYKIALGNKHATADALAWYRAGYARSLAAGGDLPKAIEEALQAAKMSREGFVLQARTLPERQALDYNRHRPMGLNIALSVVSHHPELVTPEIYQEVARSRALVAEEMARRQRNLNATNDPEVARMLNQMNQARADLLSLEQTAQGKQDKGNAIAEATSRMEKIERALAERSAAIRNDDRASAVRMEDLRHGLPAHSVLISYVAYARCAVEAVDPARKFTLAYIAFVLRPDSGQIRAFDLGDGKPINDLVASARASADKEAHSGGMGSVRNERDYREAAGELRKRVWDPLRQELGDAKLAVVVPDGVLNLIPFSGLPDGNGYLIEHGPVIHMLSSERDLVPAEGAARKAGLLAIGSPAFGLAGPAVPATDTGTATAMRGGEAPCTEFRDMDFPPLPGSGRELADINSAWLRWNREEKSSLLSGDEATRAHFLSEAGGYRVLHIATHAFVLDSKCGNGNPLLQSGLVFAGANHDHEGSILTAQQIASLDLSGVDWAVLSACNTGNGVLMNGEGVLGLERAFRVAGARNVVMTLWPVDDDVTGRFMHQLYGQLLVHRASTSDAAWNASRKLLLERRTAQKSTHPWYWAGFVSSGGWE